MTASLRRVSLLLVAWLCSMTNAGHNDEVLVTLAPTMSAPPTNRPSLAPSTSPSLTPTTTTRPSATPTVSNQPTLSPSDVPSSLPTTSPAPTAAKDALVEVALANFAVEVEDDSSSDDILEFVTNVLSSGFQSSFGVHFDSVELKTTSSENALLRRRRLLELVSIQGIVYLEQTANEVGITQQNVQERQLELVQDMIGSPYADGEFIVGATFDGEPMQIPQDGFVTPASTPAVNGLGDNGTDEDGKGDQILLVGIIAGVVAVLLLTLLYLVVRRNRMLAARAKKREASKFMASETTPPVKRVRDLERTPPTTNKKEKQPSRSQLVHRGVETSQTYDNQAPVALNFDDQSVEVDVRNLNISALSSPPPPPPTDSKEDKMPGDDDSMAGFSLVSEKDTPRASPVPSTPAVQPAASAEESVETGSLFTYGHVAEQSAMTYGFNPYGSEVGSIQQYMNSRFLGKPVPPPPPPSDMDTSARDSLNDSELTEKVSNHVNESHQNSYSRPTRSAPTFDDDMSQISQPGVIRPKPRSPERLEKVMDDNVLGISAELEEIGQPRASAISNDGHHFRSPQAARLFEYMKEKGHQSGREPDI